MTSIDPNRSKRQRKSVCHYSDDNPNTFTIKVKKGDQSLQQGVNENKQIGRTYTSSPGDRGRKRPRSAPRSKHAINSQQRQQQEQDGESEEDDDNMIIASLASSPTSRTLPPRRGRPSRMSSTCSNGSPSSSRSSSPVGTISSTAPRTKMTTKLALQQKTDVDVIPTPIRRPQLARILPPTLPSKPKNVILYHTAFSHSVLPPDAMIQQKSMELSEFSSDVSTHPQLSEWVRIEIDHRRLHTENKPPRQTGVASSRQKNGISLQATSSIPFEVAPTTVAPAVALTAFCTRQQPFAEDQFQKEFQCNPEVKNSVAQWIVTGDCVGGVSLWKVGCPRPLYCLNTVASKREAQRVIVSKKVISYPNSVQDVAWSVKDIVLILTDTDLEGIEINLPYRQKRESGSNLQTSLFFVNVSPSLIRDIPLSQRFHFHFRDPLVLWSTDERNIESGYDTNGEKDNNMTIHTLQCLNLSGATANSIECINIDPENENHFRCIVAIWDGYDAIQRQKFDSILAVAQTSSDILEILRIVFKKNNGKTQILDRVVVPLTMGRNINVAQMDCSIQQLSTHGYKYTLLAGYRTAIQLFDSRTLSCLSTFGKSISLHGKLVQWKSILWVRSPQAIKDIEVGPTRKGGGKLKYTWLETRDELAARTASCQDRKNTSEPNCQETNLTSAVDDHSSMSSTTTINHDFWLIGVPHPLKGPAELSSTLYIWKNPLVGIVNEGEHLIDPLAQQELLHLQQHVDSTSINLPSGGCLGLSIVPRRHDLELLCVTASTGQLYNKKSSFRTDFAGVMYPVGYKVIDDNIEYVEDEDEMDQPIVMEDVKDEPALIKLTAIKSKQRGRPKKNPSITIIQEVPRDMGETILPDTQDHYLENVTALESENEESREVDVLGNKATADNGNMFIVPCWPFCHDSKSQEGESNEDTTIENSDNEKILNSPKSLARKKFQSGFLSTFPYFDCIHMSFKQQSSAAIHNTLQHQDSSNGSVSCGSYSEMPISSHPYSAQLPNTGNLVGGSSSLKSVVKNSKKTRTASVEAVLQSSVVPELKNLMFSERGKWSKETYDGFHEQLLNLQLNVNNVENIVFVDEETSTPEVVAVGDSALESSFNSVATSHAATSQNLAGTRQANNSLLESVDERIELADPPSHHTGHEILTSIHPQNGAVKSDESYTTANCVEAQPALQEEKKVDMKVTNNDQEKVRNSAIDIPLPAPGQIHRDNEVIGANGEKSGDNRPATIISLLGHVILKNGTASDSTALAHSFTSTVNDSEFKSQTSNLVDDDNKNGVDQNAIESPDSCITPLLHQSSSTAMSIENLQNNTITSQNVINGVNLGATLEQCHPSNVNELGLTHLGSTVEYQDQKFVVTPSELSPTNIQLESALIVNEPTKLVGSNSTCLSRPNCAACRGRMVVHTCGRREKPVDYEAIARAERERKERLAADRALARAEKRRDADARRREAKKQKKIEEEERQRLLEEEAIRVELANRVRQEEERLEMEEHERRLRLDEEKRIREDIARNELIKVRSLQHDSLVQFDNVLEVDETDDNIHTNADSAQHTYQPHHLYGDPLKVPNTTQVEHDLYTYPKRVPSYNTINQMSRKPFIMDTHNSVSHSNDNHFYQDDKSNGHDHGWKDARSEKSSFYGHSLIGSHRATITIGGNSIQPSASLDPSDALAALAGLADSIHSAECLDSSALSKNSNRARFDQSDPTKYDENDDKYSYQQDVRTGFLYEYSGSIERQAAIHRALADNDYSTDSTNVDREATSTDILVNSSTTFSSYNDNASDDHHHSVFHSTKDISFQRSFVDECNSNNNNLGKNDINWEEQQQGETGQSIAWEYHELAKQNPSSAGNIES